jgi:hypothetical protein
MGFGSNECALDLQNRKSAQLIGDTPLVVSCDGSSPTSLRDMIVQYCGEDDKYDDRVTGSATCLVPPGGDDAALGLAQQPSRVA